MKKFEYKIIEFGSIETEKVLNDLGREGWEAISVVDTSTMFSRKNRRAILKREIDERV